MSRESNRFTSETVPAPATKGGPLGAVSGPSCCEVGLPGRLFYRGWPHDRPARREQLGKIEVAVGEERFGSGGRTGGLALVAGRDGHHRSTCGSGALGAAQDCDDEIAR